MRFAYKAQKSSGEFYESEKEAADKFALARELHAEGETLIHASESGAKKGALGAFTFSKLVPFFGRVSIHQKIIFTRNLSGMLAAGLTVSRSLGVLERQTRAEKFKNIISGLSGRISKGESLSQAFSGYENTFQPLIISMVRAGEEGGNLSNSLTAVAGELDRTYTLQRKVKGALMYPAVVIAVMLIVGIIMFIYIVPQLTAAFKDLNVPLPFTTRVVIAVSDFLQAHLITGFALIFGLFALLSFAARSAKGKRFIDGALLHTPVIAPLIKEANAARTGQTLSALLSSGVEVVNALGITADVMSNSYYRDVLLQARATIERGEPMSGVFREHEDIYPPLLSEMVAVGEETGKLSLMLKETAAFFESEVEQKTKDMSTIIEPALMVVVGVVVGFFAVAMISPMYSLMDSI